MSNLLLAKCHIKGTRMHIQHRFTPDSIPLEAQEKTGKAGNDPEEWKRTCLLTRDRELFALPTMVFGMMRDGAKYVKKGKTGSIQKDLSATMQVVEDQILLLKDGKPVVAPENPEKILEGTVKADELPDCFILISSVVNPATRARNVRYRLAVSPGWECEFSILFDKTIVSRQQVETVLDNCSKLVGFSNSRSIGHGRFTIESLEFVEG